MRPESKEILEFLRKCKSKVSIDEISRGTELSRITIKELLTSELQSFCENDCGRWSIISKPTGNTSRPTISIDSYNDHKESIIEIGHSIKRRTDDEIVNRISNRSVGRALVKMSNPEAPELSGVKVLFLTNHESIPSKDGGKSATSSVDHSVYKNSRLGGIIIQNKPGNQRFEVPVIGSSKLKYTVEVKLLNTETYNYDDGKVQRILTNLLLEGKTEYFYDLASMCHDVEEAKRQIKEKEEQLRRQKLLELDLKKKLEKENELKKQAELDAKRKEEERKRKEIEADIERMKKEKAEKESQINSFKAFLRKSFELRSQHILDPSQEEAKRSHFFDGIPIVINGGPGTGKTTTVIQRLKFLMSREALDDYDVRLTNSQKDYLTGPDWNKRWLFFSPTDILLQYLQSNMREEGLIADEKNTRTLPKFRHIKLLEYGIIDPTKSSSFKEYKKGNDKCLILDPKKAIEDFNNYCIRSTVELLKKKSSIDPKGHSWNRIAQRIKDTIERFSATSIAQLLRLLSELHDSEIEEVRGIENELATALDYAAFGAKLNIFKNESLVSTIDALFKEWDSSTSNDIDEETSDEIEDSEENDSIDSKEFEDTLIKNLRRLIKQIGLTRKDSKKKLSTKSKALYELVSEHIDQIGPEIDRIGELALFTSSFSNICSGPETMFINRIPKLYKDYRKTVSSDSAGIYDNEFLDEIIKKENNKHLHVDEQNLVLGFINEVLNKAYQISSSRFFKFNKRFAEEYRNSVRPVIGIDEATDYSILDYYLMTSFRHYEFNSITLCGDILQGLNRNGIKDWSYLRESLLTGLDEKELKISYRQTPILLNIAREMFKDETGEYPAYKSYLSDENPGPKPILLVSDDEDEKAEWICNRIIDIYNHYQKRLPSIAIFVGEDFNIEKFIERIEECDILTGIDVVDCSGKRKLENKESVRVFRLSEVKGMEFEAAFFYDIDTAINEHTTSLMRRYLYVGVSRATSHLAATLTTKAGNDDILKYFDVESSAWT